MFIRASFGGTLVISTSRSMPPAINPSHIQPSAGQLG
jgi:hypothetical protein